MGTRIGTLKAAAARHGLLWAEYEAQIKAGRKWCTLCSSFHDEGVFGKDKRRWDGMSASCLDARRKEERAAYVKIPPELRKTPGTPQISFRVGDKRQAQAIVNRSVIRGKIPSPNLLPCQDCEHRRHPGCKLRHEYDHFKGYGEACELLVEAVCQSCHLLREGKRMRCPTWGKQE